MITIDVKDWREVDGLIHQHVMGKTLPTTHDWKSLHCDCVLDYSDSLDAAMEGVEKIEGHWMKLTTPFEPGDGCYAGFTPHGVTGWNGRPDFYGHADTPARAVVLACLKAVGIEVRFA